CTASAYGDGQGNIVVLGAPAAAPAAAPLTLPPTWLPEVLLLALLAALVATVLQSLMSSCICWLLWPLSGTTDWAWAAEAAHSIIST
ncbi:hypothetical protein J8J17_22615, partial [Mycobacterium tuberculosis]|nr:hypothetical protein [Mycobacterium tuberculosis]